MKVGMLWYDDDKKRTLAEKVRRAADFYQRKYGQTPTLCLVNPRMTPNGAGRGVGAIKLCAAHNVLPHHFWVGIADDSNG